MNLRLASSELLGDPRSAVSEHERPGSPLASASSAASGSMPSARASTSASASGGNVHTAQKLIDDLHRLPVADARSHHDDLRGDGIEHRPRVLQRRLCPARQDEQSSLGSSLGAATRRRRRAQRRAPPAGSRDWLPLRRRRCSSREDDDCAVHQAAHRAFRAEQSRSPPPAPRASARRQPRSTQIGPPRQLTIRATSRKLGRGAASQIDVVSADPEAVTQLEGDRQPHRPQTEDRDSLSHGGVTALSSGAPTGGRRLQCEASVQSEARCSPTATRRQGAPRHGQRREGDHIATARSGWVDVLQSEREVLPARQSDPTTYRSRSDRRGACRISSPSMPPPRPDFPPRTSLPASPRPCRAPGSGSSPASSPAPLPTKRRWSPGR